MASMASRTLIVNPTDEQKKAYLLAFEAQEMIIKEMKPGAVVGDCVKAAKKFITERNANLKLGSNFGFGIGFQFKEDSIVLNEDSKTILQPGMTMHVRVAFSGVTKDPKRAVIAIGDTVVVTEDSVQVITKDIRKKYGDISYNLEDSDQEATPPKKASPQKKVEKKAPKKKDDSEEEEFSDDEDGSAEVLVEGRTGTSVIKSTRLRSKANEQKMKASEIEERKQHQRELYNAK